MVLVFVKNLLMLCSNSWLLSAKLLKKWQPSSLEVKKAIHGALAATEKCF